jgi:hypothetical protein
LIQIECVKKEAFKITCTICGDWFVFALNTKTMFGDAIDPSFRRGRIGTFVEIHLVRHG